MTAGQYQECVNHGPCTAPEAGGNYTIFLGLEISREQLDDNLGGLQ